MDQQVESSGTEQVDVQQDVSTEQVEQTQQVDEVAQAADAAVAEVPAYQPSFKYKVLGKEMEIDEAFRSIIKDQETEKKVREIFEKAGGLDHYKTKYSELEGKYGEVESNYSQVIQEIQNLSQLWKFDKKGFFKGLGINPTDVYKWVMDEAKMAELPPEQRAVYDERREAQIKAITTERQNQAMSERIAQYDAQARAFELSQELTKPDIANLVAAYDEIYGEKAFENEVVQQGYLYSTLNKKDISAAHAVAMVAGRVKPLVDRLSQQQSAAAPGAGVNQAAKPQKVIPNVKSGALSPAKKKITSLDELRQLAAQMED